MRLNPRNKTQIIIIIYCTINEQTDPKLITVCLQAFLSIFSLSTAKHIHLKGERIALNLSLHFLISHLFIQQSTSALQRIWTRDFYYVFRLTND